MPSHTGYMDMKHIQYEGETLQLPPSRLVLAFHLVLGKFHIALFDSPPKYLDTSTDEISTQADYMDMKHIQYEGETIQLPTPSPLVLAFRLVL